MPRASGPEPRASCSRTSRTNRNNMRAAARLIERLVHLLAEIRRAVEATTDEATEQHLRKILGGA